LWPPPDAATSDPLQAARSFVEDYIGVQDPPLSDFLESEYGGTGTVAVHGRGEDGRRLNALVSKLSLQQLDSGDWVVTVAASPQANVTAPGPLGEVTSPVRIEGRGRGFEGNVVLELREQYSVEPLAQQPVTAGSGERLKPFSTELTFDAEDAGVGAIVVKTGSGIAVADGFAAFPVRLTGD